MTKEVQTAEDSDDSSDPRTENSVAAVVTEKLRSSQSFRKARTLHEAGQYEEAEKFYRQAYDGGANTRKVALGLSRVLQQLGRTKEAKQWKRLADKSDQVKPVSPEPNPDVSSSPEPLEEALDVITATKYYLARCLSMPGT